MNAFAPRTAPIRTVVLILVLALVGILVYADGAHAADDDVNWTVRTDSNAYGAARTSFSYTINPGSSIDDALVVANRGDKAIELGVYAADGYTTDSGDFDVVVGGAESTGVGKWVQADADQISIEPGETATVPFHLTIPANATPGDYAGAILTSLTQGDDASGISVDRRLGIRITLRVAGELAPSLAIEDAQLHWSGGLNPLSGTATISYTLRNTGNTVLSAMQSAGVTGPFGWFPVEAEQIDSPPQLLPGESWDVTVSVPDAAAAIWLTGTATVVPLAVDASGSTTTLEPVTASTGTLALPWLLLLGLIALALILILVFRMRSRRLARQTQREDERVEQAVAQALAQAEPAGGADADSDADEEDGARVR